MHLTVKSLAVGFGGILLIDHLIDHHDSSVAIGRSITEVLWQSVYWRYPEPAASNNRVTPRTFINSLPVRISVRRQPFQGAFLAFLF